MNPEPMPRSTWIILGGAILLLVILTIVFVTGLFSSNPEGPPAPHELGGILYAPERTRSTSSVPACDLLTQEQVSSVIGQEVGQGIQTAPDTPFGESVCSFTAPGNADLILTRLSIVYTEGMAAFLIDNGYSVERLIEGREIGGNETKRIEDVGDVAFWGGTGSEIWNGLQIQVWDIFMDVDVFTADDQDALQQAKALGGLVLGALFPPR